MSIVSNGETDRISLQAIDVFGNGATGETIDLIIRNKETNEYFNGTAFQAAFASVAMSETDATNLPGIYHYDFLSPLSNVRVTYVAYPQGTNVATKQFTGEAQIGEWVDDVICTRKYVKNKFTRTGNDYTIFEDDKTTPFATGFIGENRREPD